MKYTITIEETCTKDFNIEADSAEEAYEKAEQNYKSGGLVLDPGECQFRQMLVARMDEMNKKWRVF